MRGARTVERLGEMTNAYRILVLEPLQELCFIYIGSGRGIFNPLNPIGEYIFRLF
jgi:hypothetical protein